MDSSLFSFPQLNHAYHRARDLKAQKAVAFHVLPFRTDWVVYYALDNVWCCLSDVEW